METRRLCAGGMETQEQLTPQLALRMEEQKRKGPREVPVVAEGGGVPSTTPHGASGNGSQRHVQPPAPTAFTYTPASTCSSHEGIQTARVHSGKCHTVPYFRGHQQTGESLGKGPFSVSLPQLELLLSGIDGQGH